MPNRLARLSNMDGEFGIGTEKYMDVMFESHLETYIS